MTAVKAHEVDRAVAGRSDRVPVLLFYGPDQGSVALRAKEAATAAASDPSDPFQLVRLDGDAVADSPLRLVEEASTSGLFGGRRVIWLRQAGKSVAPAVAACLSATLQDVTIVIEAGELARNAPLRLACEQSAKALALPCYQDDGRAVGGRIEAFLARENLTIDRGARALLVDCLGADRLSSAAELEKLACYVGPGGRITTADIEAAVSDVSAVNLDLCIDGAFCGEAGAAASELRQLEREGVNVQAVLAAAIGHGMTLAPKISAIETGSSRDTVTGTWRNLHFRRKAAVGSQLASWTSSRLRQALAVLNEASLESRRQPSLAFPLGTRAVRRVAGLARESAGL